MKRVFLLGGMDLEMMTIRDILDREGCHYLDKHLPWGAKLSAYKEEMRNGAEDNTLFVGIELTEDMEPPIHYMAIDHHNARSGEPSSLEQVMTLLHLEMGRHERLVAANDKGYISGMLTMGATRDEVRTIRLRDRRCQGVTEEDEMEAERLVRTLDRNEKPLVVRTRLSHFSPITDRLFPLTEYAICNSGEMVYYGSAAMNPLMDEFSKELDNQKAYYGGTATNRFFGVLYEELQAETYIQRMMKLLK